MTAIIIQERRRQTKLSSVTYVYTANTGLAGASLLERGTERQPMQKFKNSVEVYTTMSYHKRVCTQKFLQ